MGGLKRQHDESEARTDNTVQTSKRRKEYSQNDAAVAKIYNDLADEVEVVRLTAASQLIQHITSDKEQREAAIDTALTRLIKGVSSSRKAARLGFSVALAELLRIALQGSQTLQQIVTRITKLTTIEGNATGQEKRDAYLGKQFALQAVLQAGSETLGKVPIEDWRALLVAIAELASQRQWLRKQAGAMLYEFILANQKLESQRLQALVEAWSEKSLWKTPEGVAIWLALKDTDSVKLPKHIWHHQNPLSSKERTILAKVMQEVPTEDDDTQQKFGARQISPSFAWTVVSNALLAQESPKDFNHFWETTVSHGLFATTSSHERKALGLQIVSLALRTVDAAVLEHVLSVEVVRCILNHRLNAERYLFEAAKGPLNAILARSKAEPSSTAKLLAPLLEHSGVNFDQTTKTKTVETLLAQADSTALDQIQQMAHQFILKPRTTDSSQAEIQRRAMADLMVSAVRSRYEESDFFVETSNQVELASWMRQLCQTFRSADYQIIGSDDTYEPPLTHASLAVFKERLMSCLGHLLRFRVELACLAPELVLSELRSRPSLQPIKKTDASVMKRAEKALESISNGAMHDANNPTAAHALRLLLVMSIIQVYSRESDAIDALQDLLMSIESWDSSVESKTVFVEIIITFISKPSALYKKLAEQVFAAFATSMTSDSLRSMLDILEQKESASGQQELFDQQGEEPEDESSADEDAIDVEDDSDVEIINGVVTAGSDDSSDDSEEETVSDAEDGGDKDEEAAFDRKLADALGTAGADEDPDDDGSDMDDDQMLALEPHLTNIFKERQKQSSAKQDNKDARENIINFKNRILDLLSIYVKSRYSSKDAVELIHPLIVLIRTTTNKPTSEKAFAVLKQYFDAYIKNKTIIQIDDIEVFFALLNVIHSEVVEGGSKLHTNACSRASLFIAKVLVADDLSNYNTIATMYAKLQSDWYRDPGSKVQSSMFTEWTSWSISTRKH